MIIPGRSQFSTPYLVPASYAWQIRSSLCEQARSIWSELDYQFHRIIPNDPFLITLDWIIGPEPAQKWIFRWRFRVQHTYSFGYFSPCFKIYRFSLLSSCDMACFQIYFLFFILICCINAVHATQKKCVTAFLTSENRPYFDKCIDNECFVFRTQNPMVFLDKEMNNLKHQRPFLCSDNRKLYSGGLHGVFFDIVNELKPLRNSAYCVWAGANCTFDGIINFIDESVKAGDRHRWISGGISMALSYRIGRNTLPSASIFEGELRIIGPPPSSDYITPSDAWAAVWKPFTLKGWVFILACTLGHLLLRVWMSYEFMELPRTKAAGSFSWDHFRRRFFNFRRDKEYEGSEYEENWQRINYFWSFIATVFIAITILFWEVAIAVQVYEAHLEAPIENIDEQRFSVVKNSSMERIFSTMAAPGKRWHSSESISETYNLLSSSSNNYVYTVVYEVFNRFEMNQRPELCEHLRLYPFVPSKLVHSRKPPSLSGVWYYSSNAPLSRRIVIDKAITNHKQNGRIIKIINNYAGDDILDSCKLQTERIDWVLLALVYSLITGVLFMWLISSVLWFAINRRRKRRKDTENPDTNPSTVNS